MALRLAAIGGGKLHSTRLRRRLAGGGKGPEKAFPGLSWIPCATGSASAPVFYGRQKEHWRSQWHTYGLSDRTNKKGSASSFGRTVGKKVGVCLRLASSTTPWKQRLGTKRIRGSLPGPLNRTTTHRTIPSSFPCG